MRYFLLAVLCALSISASAQWYRVDLLVVKHQRFAQLPAGRNSSGKKIAFTKVNFTQKVNFVTNLTPADYSLELAEAAVIKEVQHNMRFRIYNVASYNFSDLAQLYMQQNRLSEAKWYFLQSNTISRQQNDDRHTITNLMALALIKAMLGDAEAGKVDLIEAHDLAESRGLKAELLLVNRELKYISDNKDALIKTNVRYAEAPEKEKNRKAQ